MRIFLTGLMISRNMPFSAQRTVNSRGRWDCGVMETSQISSAAGLARTASRPPASPVDLVEFTVGQVLRDDGGVGALPAILAALTALFGCRAALALQQGAGGELVILAAHPGQAAADRALLGQVGAALAAHGELAAEGGHFEGSMTSRGRAV